jgi:hypothetical protein
MRSRPSGGTAARAKVRSFTAATYQMFSIEVSASHMQEVVLQQYTFEEIIELALYIIRQSAALGDQQFGKAGIMLSNEHILFIFTFRSRIINEGTA